MSSREGSTPQAETPRRERTQAQQACEPCRIKKTKCDEGRPSCSSCLNRGYDCAYREVHPTRKDKTLDNVLDRLQQLDLSVRQLSSRFDQHFTTNVDCDQREGNHEPRRRGHFNTFSLKQIEHLAAAHRPFLWTNVVIGVADLDPVLTLDIDRIRERGAHYILEQEVANTQTQLNPGLRLRAISVEHMPNHVTFPDLDRPTMKMLIEAYFDTFNIIFPVVDQSIFYAEIMPSILKTGYGHADPHSILALLVFALGQVALEGANGPPAFMDEGQSSGIRGGTLSEPPGIQIFNEARSRMGFICSDCTTETVQCLILQALYYEANAMHLDFSKSVNSASSACHLLQRTTTFDYSSKQGQIVKRLYWTCHMTETLLRFDMCLPGTGIELPDSKIEKPSRADLPHDAPLHDHYFPAMLALESIIRNLDLQVLIPAAESMRAPIYEPGAMPLIQALAGELDAWRASLPGPMQWRDEECFCYSAADTEAQASPSPLFSTGGSGVLMQHQHNLDVATAHMRSRFYLARYLLFQAFIYKVIHKKEVVTSDDEELAAAAIRSVCCWSIILSPPKDKKRLVPMLFSWTQSIISALLILYHAKVHAEVRRICTQQADLIDSTIGLMLDWLRDVRQWDGIAAWSLTIIDPLFASIRPGRDAES